MHISFLANLANAHPHLLCRVGFHFVELQARLFRGKIAALMSFLHVVFVFDIPAESHARVASVWLELLAFGSIRGPKGLPKTSF